MSDNTNLEAPISIGSWILMFILQSIPVVGFIMLIIWALDSSNRTRCNYARASILLMGIIGIVFAVVLISLLGGLAAIGLGANA